MILQGHTSSKVMSTIWGLVMNFSPTSAQIWFTFYISVIGHTCWLPAIYSKGEKGKHQEMKIAANWDFTSKIRLFIRNHSPRQPWQMRCDITLSKVTLKACKVAAKGSRTNFIKLYHKKSSDIHQQLSIIYNSQYRIMLISFLWKYRKILSSVWPSIP